MYSNDIVENIRNSNDIIEVISQYVTLKKKGNNYFGLCPFHSEKTSSFSVRPDKQMFYCFGCGVGGDVFSFICKIENVSYKEAIEILANRANIQLTTINGNEDKAEIELREKIYEINEIAANFYHENLYKSIAKTAQEYVKKRKLDNKTLKEFLIGYSANYNELYLLLKEKGFNEKQILASALIMRTKDGKYIDSFRKRLMFPIKDIRGRIVAFGGRVLDDSKPKYINSPETKVYSKGRNLYGLYNAKKNRMKQVIIVEGYMDVVSLHQRGITNVVASLGTAMTEAQGRLLKRNSEKIVIGYDSDGAGQNATMRGLEILQKLGCDIRILQLEGAKDPDEFILKYGSERFQKYVDKSISLVEFEVKILKNDLDLENSNDKIKFLKQIAKVISKVKNEIEREVYLDNISKEYKISIEAIKAEVIKLEKKADNGIKILEKKTIQKKELEKKDENTELISDLIIKRERVIIYLLLTYPNKVLETIKNNLEVTDYKFINNRIIIEEIYKELDQENTMSILNRFAENEDIMNYLTGILAESIEIEEEEVEKCLDDILKVYEKEKLINIRNEIVNSLQNRENSSTEEIKALEQKLNQVIIKLAKMK